MNVMNPKTLIRTLLVAIVALLCVGVGAYSFLQLNAVESHRDFTLYELVPQDALAVLETDGMEGLVDDINALHCSKDNHFLHVSELFAYLKQHLHLLEEGTPHGLSPQMNKMLLSFHEPDSPMNQVLYCRFGSGDYELMETLLQRCPSAFSSKTFPYKGEKIRIYPLPDGHFLAVYATEDFLVASFQKRLVEQVIDTRREKKSLMRLASFREIHSGKYANVPARIYVRMKSVNMGKQAEGRHAARLGGWAEFDMKFAENAIYCSGISHGVDSVETFVNVMRVQKPVEGFQGVDFPASTFFCNCWAMSDRRAVLDFTARQAYSRDAVADSLQAGYGAWMAFLDKHAGDCAMSCLFHPKDAPDSLTCSLMAIPLKNAPVAERHLRSLLEETFRGEGAAAVLSVQPPAASQPPALRKLRKYLLPHNTLLTQMTGIAEYTPCTYAVFYRGTLLLAPDFRSLSSYIEALEEGDVLEGTPFYEDVTGSLSLSYNYLMVADMERMVLQPEVYVRLVPNFFFRQSAFFRHFFLAVQFTCTEGEVYPNIVLVYKPQE